MLRTHSTNKGNNKFLIYLHKLLKANNQWRVSESDKAYT